MLASSCLASTVRTGIVSFPDPQQNGTRLEANLNQQMAASVSDTDLMAKGECILHA